jgi:hypothetical protein
MAQSGWRLPDDLLRRVRVRAAEVGVRQNVWVVRALEEKLNDGSTFVVESSVLAAKPEPFGLRFSPEEEREHLEAQRREVARQFVSKPKAKPVPTVRRASSLMRDPDVLARQARLNKAKGL